MAKMLFSSITFLYYFLPVMLITYFLVPKRMKNAVLLAGSLVFYAWGEVNYVPLMVISILIGYISGRWMEYFRGRVRAKWGLILSVGIHLGLLGLFKYTDFFISNINRLTGSSFLLLKLVLPLGISFYTFQIISYEVDVFRGMAAQKNIVKLAVYISMFPQLIAGPIVRYETIAPQLDERTCTLDGMARGLRLFILGLGKKVILANTLGELCEIFKTSSDKSVVFFWMYGIALILQIYFDFSGYSDMAVGLGHMFGFALPKNFNYPFIAKSVTEFWRRWHMSLGRWFRDYVYIPMGGNRGTKAKWLFNVGIVWLLTGLWHGAGWNFIVWGLFFGSLLVAEKLWFLKKLERSSWLGHVYLTGVVIIGFMIFDADSVAQAIKNIGGLFGFGHIAFISNESQYYLRSYGGMMAAALVGATPLPKQIAAKVERRWPIVEPIFLTGLLLAVTACLVDGSFNPFLYFRF